MLFFFKTVLYHLALSDNGVPAKLDRFKVLQNLMLLFKLFQWPSIGAAVNPHFCTNPFGHRIPFCAPKKSPFDMYISYMYMYCICMYIYIYMYICRCICICISICLFICRCICISMCRCICILYFILLYYILLYHFLFYYIIWYIYIYIY